MSGGVPKLCLNWNNFQMNISTAFRDLRSDNDFADVTLACEDGQLFSAHKVILASSSPFFMGILKKYKNPQPLIFLKGMRSEDLSAILDFFYFGEANIDQESLDAFLGLADDLKVLGLTRLDEDVDEEEDVDCDGDVGNDDGCNCNGDGGDVSWTYQVGRRGGGWQGGRDSEQERR